MSGRLKTYVGGYFSMVDNCDLDRMSLLELDDIMEKKLKYVKGVRYYMKWFGNPDLLAVTSDELMLKFFQQGVDNGRLVEVWVDHPITMVQDEQYLTEDEGVAEPEEPVEQEQEDEEAEFDKEPNNDEAEFDEEPNNEEENEKETEAGVFMDSPFEQSEEDEPVDFGEISRESDKGKRTVNLSDEDGGVIEDESDYEAEDNIGGALESDTEEEVEGDGDGESASKIKINVLPRMPEFRPDVDMKNPVFKLGMVFPDAASFKAAIREYAIQQGKNIYFKKNDKNRVRGECRGNEVKKDKGNDGVVKA